MEKKKTVSWKLLPAVGIPAFILGSFVGASLPGGGETERLFVGPEKGYHLLDISGNSRIVCAVRGKDDALAQVEIYDPKTFTSEIHYGRNAIGLLKEHCAPTLYDPTAPSRSVRLPE